MWVNYHSHTRYCDGKGEIVEYIAEAKKQNVFSIGISSHGPLPFDCKWSMEEVNLKTYLAEIESLKGAHKDIEIYKGLEIDFIPGVVSEHTFLSMLDYCVGSVHFVDKLPDGRHWEIDNTHEGFKEGLEKIFNNNIKDAVVRYFDLMKEMIYGSTPDIIGHLDKIKMHNIQGNYFNENDSWYKSELDKIFKLIKHGDFIIEVNTRGLYQKKTTTTYPSPWILELIRDHNIPITISSDAHQPSDLINQFPETALMLHKMGFKTLSVLQDGKWQRLPFDSDGIKAK